MAIYRNISVNFWTDAKIDDEFTPEDKYFYLYLLTNPHTNITGCFEIGMKQMARETGYNEETIKRLIKRMEETHNVIRYDKRTKEIFIINWCKYNWSKSEKLATAVLKVADHIKSKQFKEHIVNLIKNKVSPTDIQYTDTDIQYTDTDIQYTVSDTATATDVSIPYGYGIDTVSDKGKAKRFSPPTLEEVTAYCNERKNSVDAQRFIDYYTSNGWKVGKNAMKDWKAAVRTWEKNGFDAKKEEPKRETSYDLDEWEKVAMNFGEGE